MAYGLKVSSCHPLMQNKTIHESTIATLHMQWQNGVKGRFFLFFFFYFFGLVNFTWNAKIYTMIQKLKSKY